MKKGNEGNEGKQLPRWFEVVLASVGLLCTSPLLLIVALIVKLTSRGPVLFRARRVGKDGEVFTLLKFRSMSVGAHVQGSGITAAWDARVTPVGRFLRRWKLDELPQLWNVLRGDMSFVGPRPEDPRFVSHYPDRLKAILTYRPGITSPASIKFRDESALLTSDDHEREYIEVILPEKLAIDLVYFTQARFWEHVGVIMRTVKRSKGQITFHLSLFTFHLSLFTLFVPSLGAQTIYEPLDSPIYNYLDRVEARYGYALLNFMRPVARMEIARVLDSLSRSDAMLVSFDREELAWYRAEFAEEIGRLVREGTASAVPADERWNLVRVRGEKPVDGFLSADIIAGGGYTIRADAENVFRRSIGISAMGYASEYIGASLRWYDNGRRGIPYDVYSRRVPEQGIVKGPSKEIDNYDWEVAEAQFTFSLPWLRIGVVKTDMSWGSGREGQIVLSSKAPSFPVINLQIAITDWLRLDYMHGWLFSDTLEVSVGFTAPGATESLKFYENKFYAAHAVTARITPALQLSLGESIVYSGGSVSPLFVIPVMPFRAADRWTRAATGNSQIFADVRYRVLPGVTVYGTGYIDELDYGKILASDKTAFDYHIAYTIGAMATDLHWKLLPLPSESSLEFSRLYPYVYTNPKPVQRYTSHSVMLGHWIGANADILTARHTVHPARGWNISAALSYARFGQSDMFLDRGERIQPAFLYGWEYSRMTVSGSVAYRPIHGLTVRAFAEYVKIKEGEGSAGSPVPEGISVGGSVGYGLP